MFFFFHSLHEKNNINEYFLILYFRCKETRGRMKLPKEEEISQLKIEQGKTPELKGKPGNDEVSHCKEKVNTPKVSQENITNEETRGNDQLTDGEKMDKTPKEKDEIPNKRRQNPKRKIANEDKPGNDQATDGKEKNTKEKITEENKPGNGEQGEKNETKKEEITKYRQD